jgi:hypothetical protein
MNLKRAAQGRAKKRVKSEPYLTKLDRFAREFDSEDTLRRVLADLFRKMGHHGVQITHGSAEKGKDIIFFSTGPMGEDKVFACAVKNQAISGRADDAEGAMTIANQARQALDAPIPNGKGINLWIDTVYIISPYECALTTMESVRSTLERSRQIDFLCGQRLLELFARHWPEFLWFESTILLSYLSALRNGVTDDYALANLVLQKALLARAPGTIKERYVQPTLRRELSNTALAPISMSTHVFTRMLHYRDLEDWAQEMGHCAALLHTAQIWAPVDEVQPILEVASQMRALIPAVQQLWEDAYRQYAAQAREEAERAASPNGSQGFAKSKLVKRGSDIPARKDAAVALFPNAALQAQLEAVTTRGNAAFDLLRSAIGDANRFVTHPAAPSPALLSSDAFLSYCRVADTVRSLPTAFETEPAGELIFDSKILDTAPVSLLISGAAGFGKTTFCRWHALEDAQRLVDKKAAVLPVYLPLHTLLSANLASYQDAFFATADLRQLLTQQRAGQSAFDRIRLYLDGLDEVIPVSRQAELARLAELAANDLPFLQVVMTGRDHVAGHWLRWLPRIRLRELDRAQITALAQGWLPADRVADFFRKLQRTPNLEDLMGVPLLATLILAVYDRRNDVPPNRTSLYALFVELLAGGWDIYKNVQRGGQFGVKDKLTVLTRLAGILHLREKRDGTEVDFKTAVKASLSTFLSSWDSLLNEIVEDGLLTRVGASLAFSHLSFQEFLAARDLQEPTGHRAKQALRWYLLGNDWWREVLMFYVSLADRPADSEHWIADNAEKASVKATSTESVGDLLERATYLQETLNAAFPAYQPVKRDVSMAKLGRRKERLARRDPRG